MNHSKIPLAQTVVALCEAKNIKHIIISPGSRNAPLTISFTQNPFFTTYSIVDERCAAFFALGIAQQTQQPVALVCTSGSALLNYYPAVAEAFYSDIPLVILSADRPQHKIDIGDGQTIRQENVFTNHIAYSANLKDEEELSQQYNETQINIALNKAITLNAPVHINIPFEEPLYEIVKKPSVNPKNTIPKHIPNDFYPTETHQFIDVWNTATRKMIVVGVNHPNSVEKKYIEELAKDDSIIVFTETTSNLHHSEYFPSIDKIIAPIETDENLLQKLQPQVLLTFGGMLISKKIKAFLRNYKPNYHFHIDEKKAYNTFFCLTQHIKTTPNHFFATISKKLKPVTSDYKSYWKSVKEHRSKKHQKYLQQTPFSDLNVFSVILNHIPNNQLVQLSNSASIRYTQLFDVNKTLSVFSNRGTSGIDGSTSTAIGASLAHKNPTTLITGDLSFFYDSNALWNTYIRNDFRIIVINNGGGGIFRILADAKQTPHFETYFETTHQLTAKNLCELFNFEYATAKNEEELLNQLKTFYKTSKNPKLLEIFTPQKINDEVLSNYFEYIE